MIDSKQVIYVPAMVRIIFLVISFCLLGFSIWVVYSYIDRENKTNVVVAAIALTQLFFTFFTIGIVLTYASREANIVVLKLRSRQFLLRDVPKALGLISIPRGSAYMMPTSVVVEDKSDIFGQNYTINYGDMKFHLWIGCNVRRLFVIYFLECCDEARKNQNYLLHIAKSTQIDDVESYRDWLRGVFSFTFGGAVKAGCDETNFEIGNYFGRPIISVWTTAFVGDEFLTSSPMKLYWSQDLAMMTESFLRTALRSSVLLETEVLPAPL